MTLSIIIVNWNSKEHLRSCLRSVRSLMKELQARPDAGVLGPRLLNTDALLQMSCVQPLPKPLNQVFDSELLQRLFPKSKPWGTYLAFSSTQPVAVEAISGAST